MTNPAALASDFDKYVGATRDAKLRGYTWLRYDWGTVTAVDTTNHLATATVAGQSVAGIAYGRATPVIGRRYPVYQTKAGDRWIKVVGVASSSLTLDQYWYVNTHITASGSRPGNDPDFYALLAQLAPDGVTVSDSLEINVRGSSFQAQNRNGAAMSPAYSGPAASAITAVGATIQQGEFLIAAGTSVYRLTDPLTNTFVLQSTAPVTVRFFAAHPTNHQKFYVADEAGGIAVTINGGATWTTLTNPLSGSYVRVTGLFVPFTDQLLVATQTTYDVHPVNEQESAHGVGTSGDGSLSNEWKTTYGSRFAWYLSLNDGSTWLQCNAAVTSNTREPYLAGGAGVSRNVISGSVSPNCSQLQNISFDYVASSLADHNWRAKLYETYNAGASSIHDCADMTGIYQHRRGVVWDLFPAKITASTAYTGVA